MSTRCQIGFYEKPGQNLHQPLALIYRHWDGYPEGVLPEALPFCVRFEKIRGMSDTEYLAARLLARLIVLFDDQFSDKTTEPHMLQGLGYGISKTFHGDLDYFYAVYGTGLIAVYTTEYNWEFDGKIRFKKIGDISVKDIPDEASAKDWSRFFRKTGSQKRAA